MSRELSAHRIKTEVERYLGGITGSYDAESIRTMMQHIGTSLVKMSTANVDEVALEVVSADALANNPLNAGTWHKVLNVKAVRDRTGVDLWEAKRAVEKAYPIVARNVAVMALENLAVRNLSRPYGERAHVDATEHMDVLSNLHAAANDNQPF